MAFRTGSTSASDAIRLASHVATKFSSADLSAQSGTRRMLPFEHASEPFDHFKSAFTRDFAKMQPCSG
ncbi:hypothetical protein IE4803_PB00220 (plasmid) [Rhizobium etli bv. phaseoli str. IE4803]|nr:hypothetical protein IE4803_PB00220 [Rhizobium etli bv. phaseoli str. IE4803]